MTLLRIMSLSVLAFSSITISLTGYASTHPPRPWETLNSEREIYAHFPKVKFFGREDDTLTTEGKLALSQFQQSWLGEAKSREIKGSRRPKQITVFAAADAEDSRQIWFSDDGSETVDRIRRARASRVQSFLNQLAEPGTDVRLADRQALRTASERLDLLMTSDRRVDQTDDPDQLLIVISRE